MHLPNILGFIAAASLVGTATARCFQSGAKWSEAGGKQAALNALPDVCRALRGTWRRGEQFCYCHQPENGRRFDFLMKYHGSGGYRELSQRECEGGLSSEINQCGRGGETSYGNWKYRADPAKTGGCSKRGLYQC